MEIEKREKRKEEEMNEEMETVLQISLIKLKGEVLGELKMKSLCPDRKMEVFVINKEKGKRQKAKIKERIGEKEIKRKEKKRVPKLE